MWTKLDVFMALLCGALGSASRPSLHTGCPGAGLVDGEAKCRSCSEVSSCVGGRVTFITCGSDQACSEDVGSAFCLPVALTPCSACDEDRHTACDPYDDVLVNSCARGHAPKLLETCPGTQTCFKGTCVDGQKPASRQSSRVLEVCEDDIDGDHFVVIAPECAIGVLCTRNESGAIVYECDPGHYFDPQTVSCELYPIENCSGVYQGFAPDRTNCSYGVVCEDGQQVSSFYCGDYHFYDVDTDTCVEESLANCSELDGCEG